MLKLAKTIAAAVFAASNALAVSNGDTGTAVDSNGVNWNYKILSTTDKTVCLGTESYNLIGNTTTDTALVDGKHDGDLAIPSTLTIDDEKYTVTQIGARAFYSMGANLTGKVSIPSTVTYIGGRAFASSKITGLSFPDGCNVTTFGRYAFQNCSNMAYENPDLSKVTLLGISAFSGCGKVSGALRLGAPNSASSSGDTAYAFSGAAITSVTAEGAITTSYPFFGKCASLVCAWLKGGTVSTKNQFLDDVSLKAVLFGADTKGSYLEAGTMLSGVTGCKVFVPANGKWDGLSVGGTDNEIIWYGENQDLDLSVDETEMTLTATPKTEAAFTSVLAVAPVFKEHFGLDTHIAITNRIAMTASVTEEMIQSVTLDVPPWYITFKVNDQEQLENVLAAVPADIPFIIDISDAGKNQFAVPQGRTVAILANSEWTFGRKLDGFVIIVR